MKGLALLLLASSINPIGYEEGIEPESSQQISISEAIEDPKGALEDFLGDFFEPSVVANIISVLSVASVACYGLLKSIKNRKIREMTLREAKDAIMEEISKSVSESTSIQIGAVLNGVVDGIGSLKESQAKMLQAIALMQENSPESRIAVLKLLAEIGQSTSKAVEKIEAEVKKAEEKKEEAIKELDEMSSYDGTSI